MNSHIIVKFAGYVASIFRCKCCKFGEEICHIFRHKTFLRGLFSIIAPG